MLYSPRVMNHSPFPEVPMTHRSKLLVITLCFVVAFGGLAVGCKKKPDPVASTPSAPDTTSAAAEPVRETPMAPVVEQPVAPARTMRAGDYNQQGILKSVYFDFDRYEIRPDQKPTLQGNSDKLKTELSRFALVIEGHCDERGTSEYNMALGDRRANAAKQYLVGLGVPATRIRTISYGEERAADGGHSETAWAKNRRAEFLLEEG